jgi:lipopolysaccharide transport system permease protein
MVIFTVVFGRIAKMPSYGIPYPILVFAAMLPWQFFANSLSEASQSLIVNTNLISRVYFPRLIIPAGAVITSLVDLLISAASLGVLMLWFHFLPDWRLLALPLFTLMAFFAALGPGLLLTALNVKFRDSDTWFPLSCNSDSSFRQSVSPATLSHRNGAYSIP